MLCVDQCAKVVRWVQRIANPHLAGPRNDPLHQRRFHARLHNQTRGGRAILAHIPERCIDDMASNRVEILGIIQDHGRVLAATFQHDLFQVTICRIAQEPLARFCRSREADHVHIHVQTKRRAHGWAIAGQYLKHAARQACFHRQFGHAQRCQCRLLGRFNNHRTARRKRWPDLPRKHH